MKSRLLKIKGAEVLSRKQLKHIKGGHDCDSQCVGGFCRCANGGGPTGESCSRRKPCQPHPSCIAHF